MNVDQINKAERAIINGIAEFGLSASAEWNLRAALGVAYVAGVGSHDIEHVSDLADIIKLAFNSQFSPIAPPAELIDMTKRMKELSDRYDELDAKMKIINVEYDALRLKSIPDKMAELDIKTVTYEGIGRVQLAADCYASIPAEVKPDAYSWLRNNEFGDLITESVNPSTLKAFAKEQMKKGNDLPEDLFKVTPFMRASIVKK